MQRFRKAAVVMTAALAMPSVAQPTDDFAAKVINAPLPVSLTVSGLPLPPP